MGRLPVHIQGILGSTRQGRFGETVAHWLYGIARSRDDLTYEPIGLRDWPLPFFNTPTPPSSGEMAPENAGLVGEDPGRRWVRPHFAGVQPGSPGGVEECAR